MVKPYSPVKLTTSLLMHAGNLQANQVDGGVVPNQFLGVSGSVNITIPFVPFSIGSGASFTHFDAGVMQASSYDELIIYVNPTLTINTAGVLNISTSLSNESYRQIAETGKPFWLTILVSGYDLAPYQASSTLAVSLAMLVLNKLWGDLISFQITQNFRGFAFLNSDLNIAFMDDSSITRPMQNSLVQACWALNVSACFITARPADYLSKIGPQMAANVNSGFPMDPPILGCNPAQRDKLVILYPNVQTASFNISVTVGQLAATLATTNQDIGFTPNYDVAYMIHVDDAMWTADGTGGVSEVGSIEATLSKIFTFAAAVGLTEFGIWTTSAGNLNITGLNYPSPFVFLPTDASVNTTGSSTVYGDNADVFVQYSDGAGGNISRSFDNTYTELT
jgi:hypothetical protein